MTNLRHLLLFPLFALAACGRTPAPDPADARARAIEQRKDALIAQLPDCESGSHGDGATGGGGRFVGRLQFTPATVIGFVRERDGRTIGTAEAIAIARDYRQASSLAKYVIFERDGASHWPVCGRKVDLSRQVAEIRALWERGPGAWRRARVPT